jgi:hypothetical protein
VGQRNEGSPRQLMPRRDWAQAASNPAKTFCSLVPLWLYRFRLEGPPRFAAIRYAHQ